MQAVETNVTLRDTVTSPQDRACAVSFRFYAAVRSNPTRRHPTRYK